jgi:hypothetical protein
MSVQAPPRVPLSIAQVEASHRLTAHPVRMVGVQDASKCEALDDTVLAKLIQRSLDGRFRLDLPIASHDLDESCTPTMGYTRGHGSRREGKSRTGRSKPVLSVLPAFPDAQPTQSAEGLKWRKRGGEPVRGFLDSMGVVEAHDRCDVRGSARRRGGARKPY